MYGGTARTSTDRHGLSTHETPTDDIQVDHVGACEIGRREIGGAPRTKPRRIVTSKSWVFGRAKTGTKTGSKNRPDPPPRAQNKAAERDRPILAAAGRPVRRKMDGGGRHLGFCRSDGRGHLARP